MTDEEARRRAEEEERRRAAEEARRRAEEEERRRRKIEEPDAVRSMFCQHGNIVGRCPICN
jgi:hypothetical protein